MNPKYEVLFLQEARAFLLQLDTKARMKILYNIEKSRLLNDPRLFKKINQHIWEFRTRHNGLQYRLLAFWDKSQSVETLVISTHGFIKKGDKVSANEITKAEEIMKLYFDQQRKP